MGFDLDEQCMAALLDVVYDAAVSPACWPDVLARLADLFDSGFADIFTRSHDRQHFSGLAYGLDRSDYDDNFLGFWFKRNVWGEAHPTRVAGEVISTRSMIEVDTLRRSEIYNEYLRTRGLHEGLRLALWVDDEEIQDISLLRPWSGGPFGRAEVDLGSLLLPHLRRAALLSHRLRRIDLRRETGADGPEDGTRAVFAFDASGCLYWQNATADRMLVDANVLRRGPAGLEGPSDGATQRIRTAIARATQQDGLRCGDEIAFRSPGDAAVQVLSVVPTSHALDWSLSRPPAAIAFLQAPRQTPLSRAMLRRMFPLTEAEADLALELAAGRSLRDIAHRAGRSRNTLRTHLARLMEKTKTNRQPELVKLLCEASSLGAWPPTRAPAGAMRPEQARLAVPAGARAGAAPAALP